MDSKDNKIVLLTATHYFNQAEVLEFAEHINLLELPSGYELYIAVADNSENWDPKLVGVNNLSVVQPSKNLGYLNGCAFALQSWAKETGKRPDWVGVVNTDIELCPDFLTRLLVQPFSDSDAVIAPDIILPTGERQNPHLYQRLGRAQILIYSWIFKIHMLGRLYLFAHAMRKNKRPLSKSDGSNEEPTAIYAPHGSAIFFRRQFFDAGAYLEFGGFLYCEELHVAEQARLNGLKVVWTPGISLQHDQHSTTGQLGSARRFDWMYQSYRFILEKYYRRR